MGRRLNKCHTLCFICTLGYVMFLANLLNHWGGGIGHYQITYLDILSELDGNYTLLEPITTVTDEDTLLVFVQSAPNHYKNRLLIRRTWANSQHYKTNQQIVVIFTMGFSKSETTVKETIQMESSSYGDILFLNMLDTYDNLTLKGLLTMNWILPTYPKVNYIFKTDDDIMLNTFLWFDLIDLLNSNTVSCAVVGLVWDKSRATRSGKYMLTRREYEYKYLPEFCSGSGYLMTRSAVETIVEVAIYQPILKRDDPFLTGVIPKLVNINLYSAPRSSYYFLKRSSDLDEIKQPILLLHQEDSFYREKIWNNIVQERKNTLSNPPLNISLRTQNAKPFRLPRRWTIPKGVTIRNVCPSHNITELVVR